MDFHGFFDEDYINNGPLGVVRDSEGVLKAFVTIMPTYGNKIKDFVQILEIF